MCLNGHSEFVVIYGLLPLKQIPALICCLLRHVLNEKALKLRNLKLQAIHLKLIILVYWNIALYLDDIIFDNSFLLIYRHSSHMLITLIILLWSLNNELRTPIKSSRLYFDQLVGTSDPALAFERRHFCLFTNIFILHLSSRLIQSPLSCKKTQNPTSFKDPFNLRYT